MRVVVPFDGSPSAGRALDYVLSLHSRMSSDALEVHLVNIQPNTPGVADTFARDATDVASRLTAAAIEKGKQRLSAPTAKLQEVGIPARSAVLLGDPAPEIATYVDEQRADAVVMGTRGLGAVGAIVLGSVASKVVHLVKVPVTLVK